MKKVVTIRIKNLVVSRKVAKLAKNVNIMKDIISSQ